MGFPSTDKTKHLKTDYFCRSNLSNYSIGTQSTVSTSFKKLSLMEKKEGFQETIISSKTKKKIKFFNLGKKNNWNKLLDKKIIRKMESNFKNEMIELGYL